MKNKYQKNHFMKNILCAILVLLFVAVGYNINTKASQSETRQLILTPEDQNAKYNYFDQSFVIKEGGTYTVSMPEGVERSRDVILITADDKPVTLILDNVRIFPDAFKLYEISLGTYGAPAIWIDTNLNNDVTIIFKGKCELGGANAYPSIMKFNGYKAGTLTLKPYGTTNDSLALGSHYIDGIGSHSDDLSKSRDITFEAGNYTGCIGANGVTDFVIKDGYYNLNSIGTATVEGGTVITNSVYNESVVTYKGGNFYCEKQCKVVDKDGNDARLVVFPAEEGLTAAKIDGIKAPCTAGKETQNQLYTFLSSKKSHEVVLYFGTEEKKYDISFVGDKPIVSGNPEVTYPDWARTSLSKAVFSGIPAAGIPYTGKRITLPDLKVTLNGVELLLNQDYTIEYTDNKDKGTARFTITGINTFKEYASGRFTIVAAVEDTTDKCKDGHIGIKITINAYSPTCTKTGYTGDSCCSACDAILSRGTLIPAKGHTNGAKVKENIIPATYARKGRYELVTYCADCGVSLSRVTKTISKLVENPKTVFTDTSCNTKFKVHNPAQNEVTYVGPIYKDSYSPEVPKTVRANDKTYKVTKISATAFSSLKNLETITIRVTTLTSKTIAKNAFKSVARKVTIRVPRKKVKAYRTLFRKKGLSRKVKVTAI